MAADTGMSPLTVEYFCFPGDDLWQMSEAGLDPPYAARPVAIS